MHFLSRTFIILGLSWLWLTPAAEAKFARDLQVRAESINSMKKNDNGFTASLDQLYKNPYVTDCELKNKKRVYQLARDLDVHKKIQTQVETITKQSATPKGAANRTTNAPEDQDEDYHYRNYSGFIVRENLLPKGDNEWVTETSSWKDLFQYHDKLVAGSEDHDWDSLESLFGGLLYDDLKRTEIGSGYGGGPSNWKVIREVLKTSLSCLEDSRCSFPRYTYLESRWLKSQPSYAEYLEKIGRSDLVERDSENGINTYLKSLIEEVELDLPTPFRKNKAVQLKNGVLTLPLYSGELYYMRNAISRYAESLWRNAAIKLHLDWKKRESPDLFSVVLGEGPTGRSLVRRSTQQVILFSDVRSHSIAHEIGHVLGFDDRYYTVWNPEKCEYSDISNPSDLMSDPETGRVRPADFKQLIREYGS